MKYFLFSAIKFLLCLFLFLWCYALEHCQILPIPVTPLLMLNAIICIDLCASRNTALVFSVLGGFLYAHYQVVKLFFYPLIFIVYALVIQKYTSHFSRKPWWLHAILVAFALLFFRCVLLSLYFAQVTPLYFAQAVACEIVVTLCFAPILYAIFTLICKKTRRIS